MMYKLFGEFSNERKYNKVAVGIVTIPYVIFVINKGWDSIYFPGGTLEENEDEINGLRRELKEELNLDIIKISKEYIETYVYSPKKEDYVLVKSYFGYVDGRIKLKEDEIEGIILYPFEKIDKNFLKWLNEKYLLGPSVIDVFINKKEKVNEIIKWEL